MMKEFNKNAVKEMINNYVNYGDWRTSTMDKLVDAISKLQCPKCKELQDKIERLDSDRKSAYMRLGEVKTKLRAIDR